MSKFPKVPMLNRNCSNCFYSVSEMCMKKELLRINHSDTKDLSYWRCAYIRIFHKNSVLPFGQNWAFSSSNLFGQKPFFACNYKYLQILIRTEKTRGPIINIHTCSIVNIHTYSLFIHILFQTIRDILNILIYAAHFSFLTTLIVYSIKKVKGIYWCSCGISCKEKWTDWILEYSLYLKKSIISPINFLRVKGIKEWCS